MIDLAARWSEDTSSRRIAASWKIEIKDLVNSRVDVAEDEMAPMFVKAAQDFGTLTSLGEETRFFILSNPLMTGQAGGEATVHACRIRFEAESPD